MDATSRRGFLKLAGLGAVGAPLGPRQASAQAKSLTFLHESSFIKTFDEYMQKTLAPAYEKETGVKINYELTSVGSLPTRISTITETGSGADVTMIFLLYPFLFDEKLLDVSDIAEEAGKKQGGWYDVAREAGFVNGKWKAVPFSNIGQLMNWRTDWFAEIGVKKFPDTWEELYEVGKKLKVKDHPSALSSATALATTMAGSTRFCGLMAGMRSRPTARRWSSTRTKPRAPSTSPANSSRRR